MTVAVPVVLVSEDALCRALMQRLLQHVDRGFVIQLSIVERGSGNVRRGVPKYRNACKAVPHIVLADLDEAACAPSLLAEWGVVGAPASLLFRFAVREAESWLLADARGLAGFIGVPINRIPADPEALPDPKQTLINIARRSRNKRLASELTPPNGSAIPIGPLYNERLAAFVATTWDVEQAAVVAPSLKRTLNRLQNFMA